MNSNVFPALGVRFELDAEAYFELVAEAYFELVTEARVG